MSVTTTVDIRDVYFKIVDKIRGFCKGLGHFEQKFEHDKIILSCTIPKGRYKIIGITISSPPIQPNAVLIEGLVGEYRSRKLSLFRSDVQGVEHINIEIIPSESSPDAIVKRDEVFLISYTTPDKELKPEKIEFVIYREWDGKPRITIKIKET